MEKSNEKMFTCEATVDRGIAKQVTENDITPFIDKNCGECYGKGYIARNIKTGQLVVCNKCVRKNYIRCSVEERSKKYASLQDTISNE